MVLKNQENRHILGILFIIKFLLPITITNQNPSPLKNIIFYIYFSSFKKSLSLLIGDQNIISKIFLIIRRNHDIRIIFSGPIIGHRSF